MLSGLKFIPRDQIDSSGKRKSHRKKKKSRESSSSSDDGSDRIKKNSRKKKWYASEEDSSSYSDGSESGSEQDKRVHRDRKEKKKRHNRSLKDEEKGKSKKSRRIKEYSTDDDCDKTSEVLEKDESKNTTRKEMGLEWMLRPKDDTAQKSALTPDLPEEEPPIKEMKSVNPRELNPYFKNDGGGYPEEEDGASSRDSHLLSTSVVGDGGASWRLKALKRAQEQAAREGKKLDEIVGERWGSLGQLAVSVASRSAAPSHAHLHAIKNRVRKQTQEQQMAPGDQNDTEKGGQKGLSGQHAKMRVPKLDDSLSWGKRKSQSMSVKDASVISSALSSLNKFTNDGSFVREFKSQQSEQSDRSGPSPDLYKDHKREVMSDRSKSEEDHGKEDAYYKPTLSSNQLAAKVMQLRLKGKHEEAEKLLKEAERHKEKVNVGTSTNNLEGDRTSSRYIMHGVTNHNKKKEEDADLHLARSIMQNKKYSISGQADDEYDYEEGPKRKKRSNVINDPKPMGNSHFAKRILTQQERCNSCFENPKRPRHLVIAIANFTYLMLPQWQPVVPGHCCILPMQHELATRSVDNNVWDEIRNFKKCLLLMFAKQDRDVVFLETVMGLAKQRRHCLIECVPLPQEVAKQAPLYFKKAIDEAEEEWSQHNAKKLIDTSEKGLRGSIPKDFPYFHVEFGLKKGFVHVIDDESQFKSNFGMNVIRGMLQLPAEDMYRRQKHDSIDTQKQAASSFARNFEPFDWTKQLD